MTQKFHKISVVLGTFLAQLPHGLVWYWGNISVYILSYIADKTNEGSLVQTPWTISVYYVTYTASVLTCDVFARLVRRPYLIVLAMLLADLTILSTYFTVQISMELLIVSFSAIHGFAGGMVYGNSLHFVIQSADDDVGLMSSILQASLPAGGIIIGQFVTWYANPLNETPNLKIGSTVYFAQKDVVDKVPSVFLAMGVFSILMHGLGLLFLQFNQSTAFCQWRRPQTSENQTLSDKQSRNDPDGAPSNNRPNEERSKDKTPTELLKEMTFYFLWISFFLDSIVYILFTNYYKLFGQIWIHDDHFLTNLGTAMLISSFPIRIASGFALDRLGLKFCFVFQLSMLVIVSFWYYFTAMVNRWLYFFVVLLYGGTNASVHTCYIATTAMFFGRANMSSNFGMVLSAGALVNVFLPSIIHSTLVHLGWFAVFVAVGVLTFLNLILVLFFIP